MRAINNILIILVSALILSVCSDFLDPKPGAQCIEIDAWSSVDNTYLYINGLYKPIYEYGPYGAKHAGVSLTDGFSDILRYNVNVMGDSGGDVNKMTYTGGINPRDSPLNDYTYECNRIGRINGFLYGLKAYTKYGNQEKLTMEAQTRFLRACLHFALVREHGSVIIRDNIDGPSEVFKERSPESTYWDFIKSDLNPATENLPDTWLEKDLGHITKDIVYGSKSRITLYTRRWEKAADAAARIAAREDELYDPIPNYVDVFS